MLVGDETGPSQPELAHACAVGRWTLPGGDDSTPPSDPPRDAWIQPAQIEALARAEVLLDLGVPWLEDLQTVLTGVIDAT